MQGTPISKRSIAYYHQIRQKILSNPLFLQLQTFFQEHFLKSYTIVWIVLGIVIGLLFSWWGNDTTTNNFTEYIVSTWDITNSIKAYGSAELVDEQQLRFNQQGEVIAVYFKKGDEVKKGDIIAVLDQKSVENSILQAEIDLANAQLQLQDVLDGNTEAQILQAENNLEQSKLKLDIAQQEYEDLLEDFNGSWSLNDKETTYKTTALDIKDYIAQGERMLISLDKLFGVTTTYAKENDDFEIYLSAKNTAYKSTTNSLISLSYKHLNDLKAKYAVLSGDLASASSWSNARNNLLILLDLSKTLYDTLYNAHENAFNALENSISNFSADPWVESFDESVIENYKSSVSNNSSKTKSSLSSILSSENKITNLTSSDDDKLQLQSKANEVANLKNTIIIQEKTLEETKKWNTDIQIAQATNTVRQREIALDNARDNIDNYQIEAPFDGTIRKIDFKVWDKITSDEEKYVYLENPNLIEVSITLDQVDVVNVKAGMSVEVELDAYPDVIFEWVLWEVDSTPITSNGVTSYTVKVAIDKWDKIIYSGMTATVKIFIESKENVILIPTTFIQTQWDKKIVLDENSNIIDITVWSTDGTMTEIVSWLHVGSVIRKAISESTSSSNFMMGWDMGWGGMQHGPMQ